jgi:hypothetical protein
MLIRSIALAVASTCLFGSAALGQAQITERSVAAHEAFLASDALQGRGSATRDEAIAAAYVASRFQDYGLTPAPGMVGYLQPATLVRMVLNGAPTMSVDGAPLPSPTLLIGPGSSVSGQLVVAKTDDPSKLPRGDVLLVPSPSSDFRAVGQAARDNNTKLLLLPLNDVTKKYVGMMGGKPRLPTYLEGDSPDIRMSIVLLPPEAIAELANKGGSTVSLTVPVTQERTVTTNAIGYLAGSDPKAGTLLLTAHLDHLGVRPDGTIMHGANDDASGTTAVLELAQALASGKQPRRSILFVCYGSEEIGEYGSTYFGEHPPVPLQEIVANIEFEMIGAQDPKLPKNTLMMTGFDRSNLGPALKQHGALVTGDPYPEEHFFQRSDNYALALKGVVAHTVSGWAVTPTYHQPTDTYANLNIPFMTNAIRSLVGPIEWLANSGFVPAWNPGGKPSPER